MVNLKLLPLETIRVLRCVLYLSTFSFWLLLWGDWVIHYYYHYCCYYIWKVRGYMPYHHRLKLLPLQLVNYIIWISIMLVLGSYKKS